MSCAQEQLMRSDTKRQQQKREQDRAKKVWENSQHLKIKQECAVKEARSVSVDSMLYNTNNRLIADLQNQLTTAGKEAEKWRAHATEIASKNKVLESENQKLLAKVTLLEKERLRASSSSEDESTEANHGKVEDDETSSDDEIPLAQPIPPQLHDYLTRLCKKEQVTDFQLLQNPADEQEVLVWGVNVHRLKQKDLKNLPKDFTGYKVIKKEREEGDTDSEQYHDTADVERFDATELRGNCELLVAARDTQTEKLKSYAVGSAHAMFDSEHNKRLRKGEDVEEILRRVTEHPAKTHYKLRFSLQDEFKSVDAAHPPIFRYQYNMTAGAVTAEEDGQDIRVIYGKRCLNDLVFLRIKKKEALDLGNGVQNHHNYREPRLVKMESRERLESYLRPESKAVRVAIKDHIGYLVPHPSPPDVSTLDHLVGKRTPLTVLFQLDSGQSLSRGDSGSILFKVKDSSNRHPLGMFVTTSHLNNLFPNLKIYQAIILDLAFSDVESENLLNDIKLLNPFSMKTSTPSNACNEENAGPRPVARQN